MKKENNSRAESKYISDYENIIGSKKESRNELQWVSKGDFFQKVSLYDNSYVTYQSLGNTELTNPNNL